MSPTMLVLVLSGMVASTVLLAVMALLVFRELRRGLAFDRRLAVPRAQALSFGLWAERRQQALGGGGREARALGLSLLRAVSLLAPVGAAEREKLSLMLRQSGFNQPDALSSFLGIKLASASGLAAGAGFWASGAGLLGGHVFLVAMAVLVGLVVGSVVPEYVLRNFIARRLRRMTAALPDSLDLMVMCLESGLTFERAVLTVAKELEPLEPSLAGEFRQLEAELRVSADRREVLQHFYRRTAIDGLRDMAMSLIQGERFGTPLTQSIRNIAESEREQRAARVAARASRLPVLMTLPMLLFVVPGTLLLVAGPAFLTALSALSGLGGGTP